MTLTYPRKRGHASFDARRIDYLRDHPDAWTQIPGLDADMTDAGRVQLDALRAETVRLGLVKGHSQTQQRDCLRRLITILRAAP